MSPPNIEEELHGIDLTARMVTVKAPCLASYAKGPTKKQSAYKRRHFMSSKRNLERSQKLSMRWCKLKHR